MEPEISNQKLEFTEKTINYISETRGWTMFLSVLGFIFLGIAGLMIPLLIIFQSNSFNNNLGILTTLPLIAMVVIYYLPIYYLYKFSSLSKKAIRESDNTNMELAFKYLKSHYKFMGILIAIVMLIYFFIGVIAGITFLIK